MNGGPRHAGSQLPRVSDSNDPPRGQQDGRTARGLAQPVWTQNPTQAPQQPHPLAEGGRFRKGIHHQWTPCSLLLPHQRLGVKVPKMVTSRLAHCWSWPCPGAHSTASRCPRMGKSLPVSHWVPTKPSGQ